MRKGDRRTDAGRHEPGASPSELPFAERPKRPPSRHGSFFSSSDLEKQIEAIRARSIEAAGPNGSPDMRRIRK